MSKELATTPECLNCGEPLDGRRWCGHCGQEHIRKLYSLRELAGHYAEDFLAVDNKLFRSIGPLFAKPGKLTVEYLQGRRQRYIRPLRFYLLASIAFFAAFSFRYDPRDITADGNGASTPDSTLVISAQDSLRAEAIRKGLEAAGEEAPEYWRDDEGNYRFKMSDNTRGSLDLNMGSELGFLPIIGPMLAEREAELEAMDPGEAVSLFLQELMRHAPKAIFLIVPLVAVVLKLLYFRRKRFYMEHFIFALHWHTLIFLLLLIILYNPYTPLDLILVVLSPVYLLFAMKRVYRQGWWRTIFKQQLVLWSYVVNVTVIAVLMAVLSTLTI